MYKIEIGENIVRLRHERKITQEKLADYLGVTKGSVSKWEKNISKPDITTLPVLAAFFDVTIDELLGYSPYLTKEQIQKLYQQFSKDFTNQDFDEVDQQIKSYLKRYYSCYPFVLQMCVLYLNHYSLAKPTRQTELLEMINELCLHIITNCRDFKVTKDATILQALILLRLQKYQEATAILEDNVDPSRFATQANNILISAYLLNNDIQKANSLTQITMYLNIISLVASATQYLMITNDNYPQFIETVKRIEAVIETYNLVKLHPNIVAGFEYQACLIYLKYQQVESALKHIDNFVTSIKELLNNFCLHEDDYFDEINEYIEKLDNGSITPRDKNSVIKDLEHYFDDPIFDQLKDYPKFKLLQSKLKEMLR